MLCVHAGLLFAVLPVLVITWMFVRFEQGHHRALASSLSDCVLALSEAFAHSRDIHDAAILRDVAVLKEAVRRNAAGLEDA